MPFYNVGNKKNGAALSERWGELGSQFVDGARAVPWAVSLEEA